MLRRTFVWSLCSTAFAARSASDLAVGMLLFPMSLEIVSSYEDFGAITARILIKGIHGRCTMTVVLALVSRQRSLGGKAPFARLASKFLLLWLIGFIKGGGVIPRALPAVRKSTAFQLSWCADRSHWCCQCLDKVRPCLRYSRLLSGGSVFQYRSSDSNERRTTG